MILLALCKGVRLISSTLGALRIRRLTASHNAVFKFETHYIMPIQV